MENIPGPKEYQGDAVQIFQCCFGRCFFAEESIRFATARSVFEETDKRASKYVVCLCAWSLKAYEEI